MPGDRKHYLPFWLILIQSTNSFQMETIKIFSIIILICWLKLVSNAQSINWASLQPDRPKILHAFSGIEHGSVFGVGLSEYYPNSLFPVLSHLEFSTPFGETFLDDFKAKLGGQINWWQSGPWYFSMRLQGIFRRYQGDVVRLLNFGSDIAGAIGYYRPHWHIATEIGIDKAIVTHFRHQDVYYAIHPEVVDGWYEPATGGNFYYGIQTGLSWSKVDFMVKAGKLFNQDFRRKPFVPMYAQISISWKY